ncbi:hypothetical protein V2J09_008825 [Rumex salicifolius]
MGIAERDPLAQLSLPPGFRFYPTDEELMVQYLCRKIAGHHFDLPIIGEIDLYKFNPWILPSKALFGEKEWYFFSPRDRKYPNGSRPNRVAGSGYWKATGTDKIITTQGRTVGIKKALVFYEGKAPKGAKTNWIMHEYRLSQSIPAKPGSSKLDDWVLCRIYKKNSSAAKAAESATSTGVSTSTTSSTKYDDRFLGLPGMSSQRPGLPGFGSGNVGWSGLSVGPEGGLGQVQLQQGMFMNGHHVSGTCVGSMPQLCNVEQKVERHVEEEVQSAQRVSPLGEFFGQGCPDPVDPFGIRYSAEMAGYGYGL